MHSCAQGGREHVDALVHPGCADGLWLLWLVSFLFGCVYSPMHPILDAVTLQQSAARGYSFGRLRMVGSLSFLVVILGAGWWLEGAPSATVFPMLVVCLAATAVASWLLPRAEPAARPSMCRE